MPRRPTPEARRSILAVANRLFSAHGIHAVGMQQIIDEVGCGKQLLYREFGTKDELVLAFLEQCRADWLEIFEAAGARRPDDPGGQLVELVRITADRNSAPDFRGCPVHNTHAEYPDPEHPVHRFCVMHFGDQRARYTDLAARAGAADPGRLADRISLILDGMNTTGAALGENGALRSAVAFAEDVVRAAVPR